MKKFLFFASALAGLFLAGSCQQEEFAPVEESGIVTFEVQVPEVATKAYAADGTNVNDLVYAVYSTTATTQEDAVKGDLKFFYAVNEGTPVPFINGKRIVSLELLNNQNYLILFWAQHDNAWVDEEGEAIDLFNVTYPASMAANNQELEAFSGVSFITDVTGGLNKKVTLTRPFAQINLATKMPKAFTATLTQSSMTVAGAPASFNVAKQVASDAVTENPLAFASAAVPGGEFKTDYAYAGANYIFAGENNTVTVGYEISTSHGNVTKSVPSVPVAKNYRTNIIGNLLTSTADYEVEILPGFADDAPDQGPASEVFYVTTDEELAKALESDAEVINIILGADLDLNTNDAYLKLGTEKTTTIVFDGLKPATKSASAEYYTLNLQTTYWSRINTANPEAKVVMKNLNLTSSQTSGTWNSYDVTFNCNVELENVNLLKALALDGEAKTAVLKNVNIDETNDYYALWISASGMNVVWEGGAINSEGRGIKIDEQYVDEPAATTLKVTGVDFNTKKKAAIMVKSKAATSIEVSDIDITDVAADPVNAVWVDEDAAQYFDLVTVTGSSKAQEGDDANLPVVVTTAEDLQAAINASPANAKETTVIYLKAGKYTGSFNVTGSRRVELMSNEEVTIDGLIHGDSGNYITLRGLKLTNVTQGESSTTRHQADGYCLGGYANCFHIEDCVFDLANPATGGINIYAAFNACEKEYELTVLNTTFNCNGQTPIRCKTNTYIDNCTFNDQKRYSMQFQANYQAASEKVVFTNNKVIDPCVTSKEPFAAGVQISHSQLCEDVAVTISGNTLTSDLFTDLKFAYDHEESSSSFGNIKITTCTLNGKQIVDGQCVEINAKTNEVLPEAAYTVDGNEYSILNVTGLKWFANQVNVAGNNFSGKTVKLAADMDLTGIDWIPVGQTGGYSSKTYFAGTFDGNGKTISNLTIKHHEVGSDEGKNYASGFFGFIDAGAAVIKNMTFDKASVSGHHWVGVVVGYLTGDITGCAVTNSTVSCTHLNDEACGDKAGSVVGYINSGSVSKTSATNCSVTAGRDGGQIVGASKSEFVSACSAENVTVTAAGECTGTNIRNELIGRVM